MLLHGCIKLLRQVVADTRHTRLFLACPTVATLALTRFLVVLLLCTFAVALLSLLYNPAKKHVNKGFDI